MTRPPTHLHRAARALWAFTALTALTALLSTTLALAGCRVVAGYDPAATPNTDGALRDVSAAEGPTRVDLLTDHDAAQVDQGKPLPTLSCEIKPVSGTSGVVAIWADETTGPYAATGDALYLQSGTAFQPRTFAGAPWSLTTAPRALTGHNGWIAAAGSYQGSAAVAHFQHATDALMLTMLGSTAPVLGVEASTHALTGLPTATVLAGQRLFPRRPAGADDGDRGPDRRHRHADRPAAAGR